MIGLIIITVATAAFCWFVGYLERHPPYDGMEELNCLMDEYYDEMESKDNPFRDLEGYEFPSFDAWYREREAPKLPPAQVVPQVYR